jgi:putative transposase
VPLSVHLSAANRHDLKGLADLIGEGELLVPQRKGPTEKEPQHLCLDKAYDAEDADDLLDDLGYTGHVKRRGAGKKASRASASRSTRPGAGKRSVRSRG